MIRVDVSGTKTQTRPNEAAKPPTIQNKVAKRNWGGSFGGEE
jgi:hypothetical protein